MGQVGSAMLSIAIMHPWCSQGAVSVPTGFWQTLGSAVYTPYTLSLGSSRWICQAIQNVSCSQNRNIWPDEDKWTFGMSSLQSSQATLCFLILYYWWRHFNNPQKKTGCILLDKSISESTLQTEKWLGAQHYLLKPNYTTRCTQEARWS